MAIAKDPQPASQPPSAVEKADAQPSTSGEKENAPTNSNSQDPSPSYSVGERVQCVASFDNEPHPAEIYEVRKDAKGVASYYVHYSDCDKRLDEWVAAASIKELLKPADVGSPRFTTANSGDGTAATGEAKAYTTRTMKRRYGEINHVAPGVEELPPLDQHFEKAHQARTRLKNVHVVELGRHEIDAWYYSPFPEPYGGCHRLYVCEWDLKYFRKKRTLLKHLAGTPPEARGPPGDLIYESPPTCTEVGYVGDGVAGSPSLAMFEVDGAQHKLYCQNLCLLAKLFLDHKTLYFDVEPFLFYVLCEKDHEGYHVVGYFSKEKHSPDNYNVACILTLPCHQRKGYGSFLIAFSYALSRREYKLGTPERPLSDLGAVSYRAYWTQEVFDVLKDRKNLTLKDLSELTCIRTDDIISALSPLGLVKYYRGDHLLAVTPKLIEDHLARMPAKPRIFVNDAYLRWDPKVWGPGGSLVTCGSGSGGGAAAGSGKPLRHNSLKPGVSLRR